MPAAVPRVGTGCNARTTRTEWSEFGAGCQDGEEVGALDLGTGIAGRGEENGFIRDRKPSLG